jgi:prepilin-type N-terminal cleavage/methylation domain-containing protein
VRKILTGERGFTLIELLVVIAVLGILMGVTLAVINPAARMNEARDSKRMAVLAQLAEAMEACYTKNLGSYASCDSATKLQNGDFIKTAPTVGAGGTWAWGIANGCISVTKAVTGESCGDYLKYATPGPVACATTGC